MDADPDPLAAFACEVDGHEWVTADMTLAHDGTYVERQCTRCDAVTMVGPRELGGWV